MSFTLSKGRVLGASLLACVGAFVAPQVAAAHNNMVTCQSPACGHRELGSPDPGTLPATGGDSSLPMVIGGSLVFVGGAVLFAGRRKSPITS